MRGHYLTDEQSTGISVCADERLFTDVGSKFVLGQMDQVTADLRDHTTLVLRPSLLNYKLDHVVLRYS